MALPELSTRFRYVSKKDLKLLKAKRASLLNRELSVVQDGDLKPLNLKWNPLFPLNLGTSTFEVS